MKKKKTPTPPKPPKRWKPPKTQNFGLSAVGAVGFVLITYLMTTYFYKNEEYEAVLDADVL